MGRGKEAPVAPAAVPRRYYEYVYSTCLFCSKPLGSNESFETFPVGKRLAFDSAKGRLWVVCPQCERWNLSPLEERWEAIEQAERYYRDTRRRVATDNIGLAKLRDGTTIVRIGEPLRPEFASWRYGDQFGRRRRRQLIIAGGGIAALGALIIAPAIAGVGIGGMGFGLMRVGKMIVQGSPEEVIAKINTEDRGVLHVRRRHLAETRLGRAEDGSLAIDLRFKNGSGHYEGRDAERIASIVIPKVNRYGGSRQDIGNAVSEIEEAGGPEAYLDRLTKISSNLTRPRIPKSKRRWEDRNGQGAQATRYDWVARGDASGQGLFGLPTTHRLALEMALHEEVERRAMRGELAELERAWRDAEEIAAISDDLLVPSNVSETVKKLKDR